MGLLEERLTHADGMMEPCINEELWEGALKLKRF